ncbi:MAG TPA: TetR/AcrR family transcriptional regulator [Gemmatimonadales bacterium]|jgi:AcrR family transcriptional regulator
MVKPKGSTARLKPGRSRPRPDQETRDRILNAADRIFIRKGTASGRTQEIAREAGVNKALVHYYFGTKAALADAIFERALGTLVPRIFGILADPARSLEQKVGAIVKEQIDFHTARPYLAGYMIAELHAHPERVARMMTAHGRIPLDVLRRQLQEGARAGKLRRISPEQFVASMMGLLLFPFAIRAALCELLGFDSSRWESFLEERRRILPDFVMAGLRP